MINVFIFYRNKKDCESNKKEVEKAMEMIKALEAKSVEGENDTSELKSDLEMVRMNFSLSGNRFKSLKDKFDKL